MRQNDLSVEGQIRDVGKRWMIARRHKMEDEELPRLQENDRNSSGEPSGLDLLCNLKFKMHSLEGEKI